MQKNISDFRLPILAGICVGTSYIPFPPWAIFFAFVPLFLWWEQQHSALRIWWGGWLAQFILTLIGFNWVAYTVHEFGHLPWSASIVALLLFASFANLHVPLAGLAWWWLKRHKKLSGLSSPMALAALLALTEQMYPMIFDWHFGYTWLWANWPAAQTAEWVGFRGLSALSILANALTLELWRAYRQKQSRKGLIIATSLLLFFLAANLAGQFLKSRITPPDQLARVLVVQANIGNLEKQEAEQGDRFRQSILDRYLNLTTLGLNTASQPIDFVMWPETAFPHVLSSPYFENSLYARSLSQYLREKQVRLVTGAYGYDSNTQQIANAIFMMGPDGLPATSAYFKTHLLAFGEFVPGARYFPQILKWLPQVADFARGEGPAVKEFGGLRLGPQICYEGLFDLFARGLARQNAQIIVNVTNDSWYGKWQEPYQHLYMTMARTIELRRPLIRSTNTGISTVGLASGEILRQSPLHEEWQNLYEVPYAAEPPTTFFMGSGYYFSWVLPLVLLALALLRSWSERAQQSGLARDSKKA